MGCIGKFLLSVLAIWGFSALGWLTLYEGASVWAVAFWVFLVIMLVDLLTILIKVIVQAVALPLSFLTLGFGALVIEGVFKYIGLFLAAKWTGTFMIPWIFGALWWQALLIGMAFAVIGMITTSKSSSSSRRRSS